MSDNFIPQFDARRTIPERLKKLGSNMVFFAGIYGISQGQMSQLMSGAKPLTAAESAKMEIKVAELENLVLVCHPIPVSMQTRDVNAVKQLLFKVKHKHLKVLDGSLSATSHEMPSIITDHLKQAETPATANVLSGFEGAAQDSNKNAADLVERALAAIHKKQ